MANDTVYCIAVVRHKNGKAITKFRTATGWANNAYDGNVLTYHDVNSARMSLSAINECIVRRSIKPKAYHIPSCWGSVIYSCDDKADYEGHSSMGCGHAVRVWLTDGCGGKSTVARSVLKLPEVMTCPKCGKPMSDVDGIIKASSRHILCEGELYYEYPSITQQSQGVNTPILMKWEG